MFDANELKLVYEDQKVFLECVHQGSYKECSSVASCPPKHFDKDVKDIILRQNIMKKIEDFAVDQAGLNVKTGR